MAETFKIGAEIKGSNFEAEMTVDSLYLKLRNSRVVSNASMNGGLMNANGIINYSLYGKSDCKNKPVEYLRNVLLSRGIDYSSVIGLLTAVRPDRFVISRSSMVTSFISAGVDNAATPIDGLNYSGKGTINIIVLANVKMTDAAIIDAFKTSVEAKSYSLWTRRVTSKFSGKVATGTITDVTAVVSNETGEEFKYAGTGTDLGSSISRSIYDGLTYALDNFYGYKSED
jgi:adenosylcobinamide amidohydrolase